MGGGRRRITSRAMVVVAVLVLVVQLRVLGPVFVVSRSHSVGSYESEFTKIRSYKHLGPQIDRERFNRVLSKL